MAVGVVAVLALECDLKRGRCAADHLPDDVGSVIGATTGGPAVAHAPIGFLKLLLGAVLVSAAVKTMLSNR